MADARPVTAAPWQVLRDTTGDWLVVHNRSAEVVCILKAHQVRDAHLIANAPSMLGILQKVAIFSNDDGLAGQANDLYTKITGHEAPLP